METIERPKGVFAEGHIGAGNAERARLRREQEAQAERERQEKERQRLEGKLNLNIDFEKQEPKDAKAIAGDMSRLLEIATTEHLTRLLRQENFSTVHDLNVLKSQMNTEIGKQTVEHLTLVFIEAEKTMHDPGPERLEDFLLITEKVVSSTTEGGVRLKELMEANELREAEGLQNV